MSFTDEEYRDFCENVNFLNNSSDELIEARRILYKWISDAIKEIFNKYIGSFPDNVYVPADGRYIEVKYSLDEYSLVPLPKGLVDDLRMPVRVKIRDNRLVFVLNPDVKKEVVD